MHEVQTVRTLLRPRRDLAALIAIYESNYVRLMRLVPEVDEMQGTVLSRVAGAMDLYLTVLERYKFTTTICLSYLFENDDVDELDDDRFVFEPRARIRIYHDVRAVDVISHCRRKAISRALPCRRGHMPELDRKWELNRFLQKWLGFCLRQGHLFLRCTAIPVIEPAGTREQLTQPPGVAIGPPKLLPRAQR